MDGQENEEVQDSTSKDLEKLEETSKIPSKSSIKSTKTTITKKKLKADPNRIIVVMYGIIRGPEKCQVCTMANAYFTSAQNQLYFKYSHVNATKPKARAIAKQKKISEMPFFKYRTPEDIDWKYITGWNTLDWDEMIPMLKR